MTYDPFKIDGPTCISFSGGRTSAYMLWRVLQSNGGLPDEAVVCFSNTGKEEPATLAFVEECSKRWHVPITWIEYEWTAETSTRWKVTDYFNCSKNGEPFENLIKKNVNGTGKAFLPNPVKRICTVELKILPLERYLRFGLNWDEWDNLIGIRADEPRRVSKIRASPSDGRKGFTRLLPLADAGIGKGDVGLFWRQQPFDLQLPNMNGVTMHGNCDLCFLKPTAQIRSLIAEKPERAVWWARMEAEVDSLGSWHIDGARFRKDRPSYAAMLQQAADQVDFIGHEESIPCFCGD